MKGHSALFEGLKHTYVQRWGKTDWMTSWFYMFTKTRLMRWTSNPLQETFISGNIDKTFLDNSNKFCQRYHVPVKTRVTTVKAISKTGKSRDKDETKKTETETERKHTEN